MSDEAPQKPEEPEEQEYLVDEDKVWVPSEDAEATDEDDTSPLTLEEAFESGNQIVQNARDAILQPAYRQGRRYLRSAESAAKAFFDGLVNEKKGPK